MWATVNGAIVTVHMYLGVPVFSEDINSHRRDLFLLRDVWGVTSPGVAPLLVQHLAVTPRGAPICLACAQSAVPPLQSIASLFSISVGM